MKLIATLSSDLILKSPVVRRKFQRVLLNNLRKTLKEEGITYKMTLDLGHIFFESENEQGKDIFLRCFGIDSISIIEGSCESSLELICEKGLSLYKDFVKEGSYAVRAKRKGIHNFTSEDVNKNLGGLLKTEHNHVNIKNSDKPIYLYIKDEIAYFYTKKIKAQGGLPLGCGGKALCLISGGFDSVLASWVIQKRGVQVDYLFCNLGGKAYERSTLGVTKNLVDLWGHGSSPRFYSLDFNELVSEVRKKVKPSFNQVILKKLFYRAAEKLCYKKKYDAIITGEAIGQVSSQTLKNLRAIEQELTLPILRPLISFNKNEIISKCQEIGTYELSAKIKEFCQITKEKPVTATTGDHIKREYERIDPEIIEKTFTFPKPLHLKEKDFNLDDENFFMLDHIPEDSVVLDCRQESEFQKKAYSGSHWVSPHKFEDLKSFSKDKNYVLFCEHSTQSLLFAEKMQKEGYAAYGLQGGEKFFATLPQSNA